MEHAPIAIEPTRELVKAVGVEGLADNLLVPVTEDPNGRVDVIDEHQAMGWLWPIDIEEPMPLPFARLLLRAHAGSIAHFARAVLSVLSLVSRSARGALPAFYAHAEGQRRTRDRQVLRVLLAIAAVPVVLFGGRSWWAENIGHIASYNLQRALASPRHLAHLRPMANSSAQENEIPLNTYRERVWYAYQCLPRVHGKPPGLMSFGGRREAKVFTDLFLGRREWARDDVRAWLATVLDTPQPWLDRGVGEPPSLTWLYKAMPPRDPEVVAQDPTEWTRKYTAIGPIANRKPNNFQAAALFYGSSLTSEVLEQVAREALGREHSKSVRDWARRLRLVQVRTTGRGWGLGLPSDRIE